jgi:peptide chain release factor 3
MARWVKAKNIAREMLGSSDRVKVVEDHLKRPVVLFKDEWTMRRAEENNKDAVFFDIPPSV